MTQGRLACVERPSGYMTKDDMREAIRIYRAEVARLREALNAAMPVVRAYAAGYPKWADIRGVPHDPNGAHAALAIIDAALAAGEGEGKT